jgi:hypothetical protein
LIFRDEIPIAEGKQDWLAESGNDYFAALNNPLTFLDPDGNEIDLPCPGISANKALSYKF